MVASSQVEPFATAPEKYGSRSGGEEQYAAPSQQLVTTETGEEDVKAAGNGFDSWLARILPYIEQPELVVFYDLEYKPSFRTAHLITNMGVVIAMLSMWVILPFWTYGVGQDDYYVGQDDMCDGPVPPIYGEPNNATCNVLKQEFIDAGWIRTGTQFHLHRYGSVYNFFVGFHVFTGTCCNLVAFTVSMMRLFGLTCQPGSRARMIAMNLHYYGFLWGTVLHLVISMPMAYKKMLTVGPASRKWYYTFGADFFYEFYFAIICMLMCLQTSFHSIASMNSPVYGFLNMLCRMGGITMCFGGWVMLLVFQINPDVPTDGNNPFPVGTDQLVLAGMLAMSLESVYTSVYLVAFRTNHARGFSAITNYYFMHLILAINITYRVNRSATGIVALFVTLGFFTNLGIECKVIGENQPKRTCEAYHTPVDTMPYW
eukprot:TRINITY_DN6867_c0_g1_i1.p1 TRINITY_DN6867_c0_g1~~TRINITY_DN6867_c0_g1_i1.p1  ORF type:complete len:428 (+),score=46.08 TRINITY_DN6867_c0_g1_i1:166-1449(+)